MSHDDLIWLAGLLEGEGSFLTGPPSSPGSPVIRVVMTDRDVIERASSLLGTAVVAIKTRQPHWKQAWTTCLRGQKAVLLMRELRSHMGIRRTAQIDRAIGSAFLRPRVYKLNAAQRDEIRTRFRSGEKAKKLALEFGVTHWNVYAIHQERPRKRAGLVELA